MHADELVSSREIKLKQDGDPSDLTPTPAPQSAEKPSESPADPTPAPEVVDDGDDDDYDDGAETPAPETVPTPVPMPAVDLTDPPSSPAPTTVVGGTETCDEPVAAYEQVRITLRGFDRNLDGVIQ